MAAQSKLDVHAPSPRNHIIGNNLVNRRRSSYSAVYQRIVFGEQSMDWPWWILKAGEKTGNMLTLASATALSMLYPPEKSVMRKLELVASRISLMILQLATKFSVSSLVIFLLQLATEFDITPVDLIKRLIHLYSDSSLCSTQLIQSMGTSVRTFLQRWGMVIGDADEVNEDPVGVVVQAQASMDVDPNQVAAISGLLAGVAVVLGAVFAGSTDYSPNRGFLRSVAEFGSKASKMKNGLYAVMTCVRDFSSFVKECVLNYFGSTPADSVVKAIESLKVQFEGEPIGADKIFQALAELNTPDGEELMSNDLHKLKMGVAISGVLSKVVSGQLSQAFQIPSGTVSLLSQTLRTFEARLKVASNKQNMGNIRFVPYVIWIAGEPGCGKSVAMTHLSPDLMNALLAEDALRYEIPTKDMWCFTANFTQEFHTGYHGQYQFRVDDMCQDQPGVLRQSSPVQMIQWVSSVPANLAQAALEDKRCPFSSKMMMCTSNTAYPNRSSELIKNEAFLRRRNALIWASRTDAPDPALNWPVKFKLLNPVDETAPPLREFANYYEMAQFLLEDYKRHFDAQTALLKKINESTSEGFMSFLADQSCALRPEDPIEELDYDGVPIAMRPETEPTPDVFDDMLFSSDDESDDEQLEEFVVPDRFGGEIVFTAVSGESRTADVWLALEAPDDEYDQMRTVMSLLRLPVYRFARGRLVSMEDAEIVLTRSAVEEMEAVRPMNFDISTFQESLTFVQSLFDGDVVEAEQSVWSTVNDAIKVTMAEFAESVVKSYRKMISFWEERIAADIWWKVLLGVTAAAAMYFTAEKFGVLPSNWREISAEESYDHDVGRAKPRAQMHNASYKHDVGRSRPSARTIQAVRSTFVESVYHRNMVTLRWVGGPLDHFTLNGIFLKDKKLLTCRHFFVGVSEDAVLEITRYPRYAQPISTQVAFDKSRLVRVKGAEDAVIYDVVSGIDNFKDISTKFFSGSLPDHMDAALPSLYPATEIVLGGVSAFTKNTQVVYDMGTGVEQARVITGFTLNGHFQKGKSGSPLVADEKVRRAPTLFGIQVAVSDKFNSSYFEAISQEQIDLTLAEFKAHQSMMEQEKDRYDQEDDEAWFDAPEYVQDMCGLSLEFVGPVKQKVPQPLETRLLRSPLFEEFAKLPGEVEYLPSVLKDRNVDILAKSMASFKRKYGCIRQSTLKSTISQFIDEDRSVRNKGSRKLLTRHQILNGLPGRGLKGVELKTSPGIPLIFQKEGCPGKTRWITMKADGQRQMSEAMWAEFDALEKEMSKGQRMNLTAYACLKDELRKVSAVEAKKTRSFIILPMMYNLMIRKYFGQWIATQHELAGQISSCVGIDANTDWTSLYRRMTAMGEDIEDFDYTEWDRSLHPEWFGAYAERVSAWYGDKKGSPGYMVRAVLMDQLTYMNVQVGDWLLRTHGGNKSGCAITAEINTDIHDMLAYYVWHRICDDTGRWEIQSLPHFRERVSLALYGDDMLKATRSDVTPWFNGNTMKEVISELGMIITPGDKDLSAGFRIKTMEDVTFLKRKFLSFDCDTGLVRAPLDKSVIQRIVLWIHKSDSDVDATAENVKGALRESFFWGEEFFCDFKERCLNAWERSKCAHVPFPVVNYQNIQIAWSLGRGDVLPARYQFSEVSRPVVVAEEELEMF